MNRFIISILLLVALPAVAQIRQSLPDGYLLRGSLMLEGGNLAGCADQLAVFDRLTPEVGQKQKADWLGVVDAARSGSPSALRKLEGFINDYPQSALRPYARLLIGSDYFYKGKYKEALSAFDLIDSLSLDSRTRQDLDYRVAVSRLMTGDYATAEPVFERLKSTAVYGKAARFYLAYAAYARGDYDKALALIDDVDKTTLPGSMADYYLAQIYYARKDFAKALDVARPLTADKRGVPAEFTLEACRVTGESMFELGREEESGAYLQRYVAGCTDPLPSTRYILGLVDYRAGRYADALSQLRLVAGEDNATGQSANLLMGQCYVKDGDTRAALLAFKKASDMDYDKSVAETALYNYAVTGLQGSREPFGSTVSTFQNFLSRYPRSSYAPKVEEYLISGYITDNDYDSALKSINSISRPSDKVLAAKQRVLFVTGTRQYNAGDFKSALSTFNQAAQLAKYDAGIAMETMLWRGECFYRLGDYTKAEQAFRTYLSKAPKSAVNRTLAAYDLGYTLYARKKYAEARTQFQRVIADRKTDNSMRADAHNRVADTYYYTSDFNNAATHYDEAYNLNPSAGDYALYRHALMRGLARNHKGKIDGLDAMMKAFPASGLVPAAMLEKAHAYSALGDTQNAMKSYRQVVDRYPSTAQGRNALLQLAITRRNSGDESGAVKVYREVITRYATSDEASVAADDLKEIYAERGAIDELDSFLASVPGAPRLNATEKSSLASNALLRRATQALDARNNDEALVALTELTERYPHSEVAEDALSMKADLEYDKELYDAAMSDYAALQKQASDASMLARARLGQARCAYKLKRYPELLAVSTELIDAGNSGEAASEVLYYQCAAYAATGSPAKAVPGWTKLAKVTGELYGSMSAYELAQHYFDTGNRDKALAVVNKFIDSNPPHQYWLARGFILLSDILRAEGKTYEADEYLKSLKSNYPGKEADIKQMINKRLN